MDTNLSAKDPRFAYGGVRLLYNFFDSPQAVDITDLINDFLGQPAQIGGAVEQDGTPRFAVADANGISLFLILGATTTASVQALVTGWLEPRDRRPITGFTSTIQQSATRIAQSYFGGVAGIKPRVIIFGYSAGGAIAQCLGSGLANNNVNAVVSVCTFGQPRPGDDRTVQACLRLDYAAWANVGDNIRYCPPNGREGRTLHQFLSRQESVTVNQLGQLELAQMLTDGALIVPETPGTEGGPFTDLTIVNFLFRNGSSVAENHRLSEYHRRLLLYTDRNPPVPQRPRAQNQIGVPPVPPLPFPPVGGAAPQNQPATLEEVPARTTPQRVFVPPYRAVKTGKIWTVVVEGNSVYVAKGKQDAKRFASRMNSAYLHWWNAPAGDGPALADSVSNLFLS